MSWGSDIAGHISKMEHDEAQQIINQLPSGIKGEVQHISNALAKATKGISGGGKHVLPGGTAGDPALYGSIKAGPPRPHRGCGYGGRKPPTGDRRPFQFMMMLTIPAGTPFTQSTTAAPVSFGDFVTTIGTVNAFSGCGQLIVSNQFPNWFVSSTAWMTISVGGTTTLATPETLARLAQIEILEFHAGQEVARYPLRTFHPHISRYASDSTGTASSQDSLDGAGVLFPQTWVPLTNYNLYLQNQGPTWTPVSQVNILLSLVGSVGTDCG